MSAGDWLRSEIIKRAILAFLDWLKGWARDRSEPDEHTADLSPADRAESFTKAIPPKPKRRTAKRAPIPPESLSGGQ